MATRSPFGTLANLSIMATSFIAVAISYTLRYIELESEDIEVSTRPNKKMCVSGNPTLPTILVPTILFFVL
jgi:hypothetical protein